MPEAARLIDVDGRRVRATHLDKVLYPATGTTKADVIAYYRRIAPLLLPWVEGRPVTRRRWVHGVGTTDAPGESFFAKQVERGAPDWLRRLPIAHAEGPKEYPLVDDAAALVWFAQTASLELHVPQWRFAADGTRANPDRMVLDLDPGPGADLALCAHVARLARAILADIGLDPVPVTSGSKGIHLYSPLDGAQTSDQVAAVAAELARALEADHPDIVTSRMTKSVRAGRVFIDWSQNTAAKTTIAPYSLRGGPVPTVAAPRTWDELDDPALRQLDPDDLGERIAHPALAPYLAKRDAERTPEPMPRTAVPGASGPARFVLHEHHARRRHHDLRIEHDGVLVCWAVPKGLPEPGGRNRLAVMTEPHPLEYLGFHGEIPRGEYGAGTMTIADTGTVELEKWRDDEVIGTFHGTGPLDGVRLALIRTAGEGEKSTWLLHRMAPRATGLLRPMLASAATPGLIRAMVDPWAEIKWDGIRAIGTWHDGRLRLQARSGTDITDRYPELTAPDAVRLAPDEAMLDGEIIAPDADGRPSFALLQRRMHLTDPREIARETARVPVVYQLFDLLRLDGHDLARLPLRDRRALLETLGESTADPLAVPPVFADPEEAMRMSERFDLEGIVVKAAGSRYRSGVRSDDWLKVVRVRTQEVVIIGVRPGRGDRASTFGSLLMGVPDGEGGLRYVGRVGTGFDDRMLRDLASRLESLRVDAPAVHGVPDADARDAEWVRPELVGEVAFAAWTPAGSLRHPRWRGLRADKDVADIAAV